MYPNSSSQWKAKSWGESQQRRSIPYDRNAHRGFTDGNLKHLLELVKNFNDEFSFDDSVDVWKNDRLWNIIANEMNDQRCTAAACKTEFSKLFGRYFLVLKQKSYENALKFPFFRMLHDMDLKCFSKEITQIRDDFDVANKDKFLKEADELLAMSTNVDRIAAGCSRSLRYTDASESALESEEFEKPAKPVDLSTLYVVKKLEVKDQMIDISSDFGKTFRNKLYIHDIECRKQLVAAFRKWNHRFMCISNDIIFDENDAWNTVYNEIKNIIPDYSAAHCSAHFSLLFYQYKYILERLAHWPHEKAQKYWPFFRTFHTQLKLDSFFYDVNYNKNWFENHPKELSTPLFGVYEGSYYAADVVPKSYFNVMYPEEKEKLLKVIKKFEEEFVTISMSSPEKIWDSDSVWKFVVKDMNTIIEKNSMVKCKQYFIYLLDQYITILKNLPFLSIEEAKKLFKLFDIFHTHLNLTPFNAHIKEYKKRFAEYTPDVTATSTSKATSSSSSKQISTKSQKVVEEKEETDEYDEDQENIELVLSVQENIKMFKDFKISDDDAWMRVALDLNKFEASIEKGKQKWKEVFYSLMRKFLRYSEFGDEEGPKKWVLYNQFKFLDLNPFLDRLQNPIKETKSF